MEMLVEKHYVEICLNEIFQLKQKNIKLTTNFSLMKEQYPCKRK